MEESQKPSLLQVYKASAGSGKTYRLAKEYIKLLIEEPYNYTQILAVTFTNKATEEMKMRILGQLYAIGYRLDSAKRITEEIRSETGFGNADIVVERAAKALRLILHDYSRFQVTTIDSFFQQILRNLARELNLSSSLRLYLDNKEATNKAVDRMIEQLKPNDKALGWIINYTGERIEENESWNVVGDIKRLATTIFRDFYKEQGEQLAATLAQPDMFDGFRKELTNRRNSHRNKLKALADRFFELANQHGFGIADFKHKGGGACNIFNKIRSGETRPSKLTGGVRVKEACEDVDKLADSKKRDIYDIAVSLVQPLLRETVKTVNEGFGDYISAVSVLSQINQLRLLGLIESTLHEMNDDEDRFMLADTPKLLSQLISGDDSPFVYEKIGSEIRYIMIDEFQDTGLTQWSNFKALLLECLATNGAGLIVGDVKQSIYRWRDGDWRLLNNIHGQLPQIDERISVTSLADNWRSERNIIRFNNMFFEHSVKTEAAMLRRKMAEEEANALVPLLEQAYADCRQNIPEPRQRRKTEGYVSVSVIEPSRDNYANDMLERMEEDVRTLLEQGYPQSEIAILVRGKTEASKIIGHFATAMPELKIVSGEAYRLESSAAVSIVMLALKWLNKPIDDVAHATLAARWHKAMNPDSEDTVTRLADYSAILPAEFTEKRELLAAMPVFEMAEEVFRLLGLERIKGEESYIATFYDQLAALTDENFLTLQQLIEEWDSRLYKLTIDSTDSSGMQLMTIHKSKGLEFNTVLIPFCDWTYSKDQIEWMSSDEPPYNQLPIMPVKVSEDLALSAFHKDYSSELLQQSVDNMNLLYVAFTRPRVNMFIYTKGLPKDGESTARVVNNNIMATLPLLDLEQQRPDSYSLGSLQPYQAEASKHDEANILDINAEEIPINVCLSEANVRFRQSGKSDKFFEERIEIVDNIDNVDNFEKPESSFIELGIMLHSALQEIKTTADVPKALRRLEMEGMAKGSEKQTEHLRRMLEIRLSSDKVKEWFSPGWIVLSECELLSYGEDGKVMVRRPDRVMTTADNSKTVVVDFKLAKPSDEHQRQISEYVRLLRSMGYNNVEGYFWYVMPNRVVRALPEANG